MATDSTPISASQPKPTGPPPFKIQTLGSNERRLKALFYGPIGIGKTTLAASANEVPEMRDVFMIQAEGGEHSVEHQAFDFVRINRYQQMARIYEFLRRHCQLRDQDDTDGLRALEARLKDVDPDEIKTPRKYQTLIVDSLSEVQKYCMYMLTGIAIGDQKLDVTPDTPEFKEWGQNAEMIRLLVRSLRDLPMHVIFCSAEAESEDERHQKILRISLPGKLSGEVGGFLDVVGYMAMTAGVKDEESKEPPKPIRRLYLEPHPRGIFHAKNRFAGFVGSYLDQPTMEGLLKLSRLPKKG